MADDEDDDGEEHDDGLMGGVTFEEFYRDQRFAAVHAQPDRLLQAMIFVADSELCTFGLTLFLHGTVVSGIVVGVSVWLNEVAADLDHDVSAAAFAQAFRELAVEEQVRSVVGSNDDASTGPSPTPIFVHLRDATVWQGALPLSTGIAIRLRVSEVTGWMFANITPRTLGS